MNKLLIAAAAFIALPKLNNLFKLKERIGYKLISLKPSFSSFNLVFTITLEILNPSKGELKIKEISGKFLIDGRQIGDFLNNNPFTIRSNSNTKLTIQTKIRSIALIRELYVLYKDKKLNTISAVGVIETSLGNIPIQETQSLTFKKDYL